MTARMVLQAHTLVGQEKLSRLMRAVAPRQVLKAVGMRLQSYVTRAFETRRGGTWRPLAPLTLLLRPHGGDVPLQDTGRYKQSFVLETDDRSFVEVGSNLRTPDGRSLAKIHEFGTAPYLITVRKAKVLAARTREGQWIIFGPKVEHPGVPARPVLPTEEEARRMVEETVEAMLKRVTARREG